MSNKNLQKRWAENKNTNNALINLLNGIQIGMVIQNTHSPFESINGKIDLRGITCVVTKISSCSAVNIDFSYSVFDRTWIEKSKFSDCLFSNVDFSDISDHGNVFQRCTFTECRFNAAAIGYEGSKYISCNFNKCRFDKTSFIRPEFTDIVFNQCRIRNVDFNASSFEDCVFKGQLHDVWFRGSFPSKTQVDNFGQPKVNLMRNVSFEELDFHNLTFSDNCNLSSVKIKEGINYFKFDKWSKRIESLRQHIGYAELLNDEMREIESFMNIFSVHAKNQDWYILNQDDIQRDYGKNATTLIFRYLNDFK
ncbi:MAG: pentapeptide repeat-containing protein [Candidatus Kapabacteria bacterium]|nr:pentapeptide repeat-containing protein [Candidatus Kapabacteria bacterium]